MKCPKCDGHGFELLANRFGRIRKLECDLCNGTGYLPTTNEEWLRQANTEQVAEWIASVVQKAISIKESNGIVMLESAIWWGEWLKQLRKDKNEKEKTEKENKKTAKKN